MSELIIRCALLIHIKCNIIFTILTIKYIYLLEIYSNFTGMRDSDEEKPQVLEGPDYLVDPHSHKGPRVKSAKVQEDVDTTMESIKELRQSLASNAVQQNFNPPTGYIIYNYLILTLKLSPLQTALV